MVSFRLASWVLLSLYGPLGLCEEFPDHMGLHGGYIDFETESFKGKLARDVGLLVSLSPKGNSKFDFLPFDKLAQRADNGNNHLGDIHFHYRVEGNDTWVQGDSSAARKNVTALETSGDIIARSDLAPLLNDSLPLSIIRTWATEGNDLAVSFNITNTGDTTLELGALGFPIENNNIFTRRRKPDVDANCSLADPYIGLDGGYVQITRVSGASPVVVITPIGKTPFEAWSYLHEDTDTKLNYQSNLFEGLYRWDVYSKAVAELEWANADPWNKPTSKMLKPGESLTHGLRLTMTQKIEDIESVVSSKDVPVVTAYPGLIIPTDMTAKLDINWKSPVKDVSMEPGGAFTVEQAGDGKTLVLTPSSSAAGRVRLTLAYEDGKQQTVQYFIVKSGPEALDDLGKYLNDNHWYANEDDAFGRGPSFMLVDHATNDVVTQEYRVWMVGLCHEAGASWMTAAIKQIAQPNRAELAKLEEFVDKTLWHDIEARPSYAVPYSLFWYSPDETDFVYDPAQPWQPSVTWSWPKKVANKTDRAYGYVFPTVAYWSLYRVARSNPAVLPKFEWDFYLRQAFETFSFCFTQGNGTNRVSFREVGLMGETVFAEMLKDLKREGWTSEAALVESLMKDRAEHWTTVDVPFGSEQPWDCTGQEGVYYWSNYFNYTTSVDRTLASIRGFMPAVAHWGYNGNARRYWDFTGGGQPDLARIERQIHHYGSALNALPLLHHLRTHLLVGDGSGNDTDTQHLLRLAFGGSFAPLANIHPDGFASAAFHAFPETLAWDTYSGDYGPGFVGMMLGAATYVVGAEDGSDVTVWGGELKEVTGCKGAYDVVPRDAVRMRVFIGPLGLWIEIAAGAIEKVRVTPEGKVLVKIVGRVRPDVVAPDETVVWLENLGGRSMKPVGLKEKRGGWVLSLKNGSATLRVE